MKKFKYTRLTLGVLVVTALMLAPVVAIQQLTPKQIMAQVIALASPLDSYFTGTTLTQFRQALTRFKNIYAAMPDDPAPSPDVNCTGNWSAWTSTGTCTTCTNGTQSCTEQRTFTADPGTPSGNGQACPASPETRQVTQSCQVSSTADLESVSVAPTTVDGGGSVTVTATLTAVAPGARDVVLSTSPSGIVTLPSSLRVKEGAMTGSVTATTTNPTAQTAVTITGTLGTITKTATVTVNPSTSNPPPPPPPPPPSSGGEHDFWLAQTALPETLVKASLRDPNQLKTKANGGYAFCNSCPLDVTYNPTGDPDPRKQDAAKLVIGTASNSLRNQLRIPTPQYTGSVLFVWEAWFGKEFNAATSGLQNHKTFQIACDVDRICTEIRNRYSDFNFLPNVPPGQVGYLDTRYYNWGAEGPGVVRAGTVNGRNYGGDALGPIMGTTMISPPTGNPPIGKYTGGNEFPIAPETWTRYYALYEPNGAYMNYSLYVADARGVVQVLDKLPIRPLGTRFGDSFWFEFNTSNDTVKPGRPPLVAYIRNFFVQHGVNLNILSKLAKP